MTALSVGNPARPEKPSQESYDNSQLKKQCDEFTTVTGRKTGNNMLKS